MAVFNDNAVRQDGPAAVKSVLTIGPRVQTSDALIQ